ncbi:MAG TPA: hypothetical protein VFA65_12480, partial [Bryobacteraceae bacterium]|nr:hypothetical protein [Bryobacteraceae bacterium]
MNALVNNSLARGRKISDDPGLNASSSNGTAETVGTVNDFGGDVPFDSEISHFLETSNLNMAPQEEGTPVTVKTIDPSSTIISTPAPIGAAAVPSVPLTEITIAEGGSAEIDGPGAQSVSFVGTTGTLKIDHSLEFGGQISGFAGSDA